MEYTDFFELLGVGDQKPVAALFTTYGFDAELFEKHVLPAFLGVPGDSGENERRFRFNVASRLREIPVTVISDGKQYNGGRSFLYEHVTVGSMTFHPKFHLLLFQNSLRIIVGSCNITKSGLCYNAETIWFQDIVKGDEASISVALREILGWFISNCGIKDDNAIKEIVRFVGVPKKCIGFPKLLFSMRKECIFNQYFALLDSISGRPKRISIISPFYESDREAAIDSTLLMKFADEFYYRFPNARLSIYFPVVNSENNIYIVNAPVNIFTEIVRKYETTQLFAINEMWDREDGEDVPRKLHAKIIIAEYVGNKCLTVSGSINFTNRAMHSSINTKYNVEIGVAEYCHGTIELPDADQVYPEQLKYEEYIIKDQRKDIFIDDVVLEENVLKIWVNEKDIGLDFSVFYDDTLIIEEVKEKSYLEVNGFCIKSRTMDLYFKTEDYGFWFPIKIIGKELLVTDDLKVHFDIVMSDIIDFWAGKYRNLTDIEKSKRIKTLNDEYTLSGTTVYFRHNLQRFFKAIDSIRHDLEKPFYSEIAFISYINGPLGIRALVNYIISDYKNTTNASASEAFVMISEIENMLIHIKFEEDRIPVNFKKEKLREMFEDAVIIRKEIYLKAPKRIKKQYDILINQYKLEK